MVAPSWESFQRPGQQRVMPGQQAPIEEPAVQQKGELRDEATPEGEKPQWGDFLSTTTFQGQPDPQEEEGWLGYLGRNLAANISRLGEVIGGAAGDVEKFGKEQVTKRPWLLGPVGWGISQLVGPEKWENAVQGAPGDRQRFPTSQNIREGMATASGGATEPKTPGEKKLQEFVSDVGATLISRTPPALIKNLLIPAAANVSKRIVADTGFGEDAGNLAKVATWLPLSLANGVNASRYASDLMNQGRQGMPQNLQMNVPRFMQNLRRVNSTLLNSDPRTALARQTISGIENDIRNGQNSIRSLMTMYDGVNAAKRSRGLFELNRADQAFARRAINRVQDVLREEIQTVGRNQPQALQNWQNGLSAWATIHQSNALSNWINDLSTGRYAKILTGPAAGILGIGAYGAKQAPLVGLSGAAAVPAAYKTGQTLYRMWNNPVLYDYYWRAISAAAAQDAPAFIKNYVNLNKGLEKEEKSNRAPASAGTKPKG